MVRALCTAVSSRRLRWHTRATADDCGAEGERRAAAFLRAQGLRILQRNYRCRTGELDVIAEEGATLVFVEVKTRRAGGDELPEAALTAGKKHRVCKAAQHFMRSYKLHDRLFRFDLVGLEYDDAGAWQCRHWRNVINYRRGLARRH
jgi:putative endonuclease